MVRRQPGSPLIRYTTRFRSGLFRRWEKDRPGLSLFRVYSPDGPAEAERATRVPQSLTAARLSRPIAGKELIEKLQVLVQRQSASKS